jgi:tRNA (cytidine32/uridine32-2'-O)-methyltransferase
MDMNALDQYVKVVLVETSHPGNIGAAARAMKNMGLSRLVLVSPEDFPNEKAVFRAASAADLLASVEVYETLDDAIADCSLVVGTSARERRIPWPVVDPRQAAQEIGKVVNQKQGVAILFGRESKGLKNEELHQCHLHLNIPTSEVYSSLNLAMAVQVVAYELRLLNHDAIEPTEVWDQPLATSEELNHLFDHLETTLTEVKFHDPDNPRQLMTRLRRLFLRARPDQMEVNILRGFLKAVNQLSR